VLAILSASILYLKFKTSDNKTFWKRMAIVGAISIALSLLIGFTQKIETPQYVVLLFATSFAVVANIYYAITVQKAKLKKLGASTAHLGFGLSLLGILLSSYNKEVISVNTLGIVFDFGNEDKMENVKESMQNMILYKNFTMPMGEYGVTYLGDSISDSDPRTFYKVKYERRDSATQEVVESFMLYPDAFVNPKGESGLSANPDSKHYLTKDIFTYITSAIDPTKREDSTKYKAHKVQKGDTVYANRGYIVFEGFNTNVEDERYVKQDGDVAVSAMLTIRDLTGKTEKSNPVYYIRNNTEHYIEDTLPERNMYIRLGKIIPEENAAEIMLRQSGDDNEYIVMKAILFPYINLLWLGIIVMVFGFFVSMWNRMTKKEKAVKA
jgi:cytochrome c-type biogenesis protein CcmF